LKYFTKELYKEMQVYGFLSFPSSKEEWEEMLQSYEEMGIDYLKTIKDELEFRKDDLLKYLPESMHPSIHNKTLMTEYPSDELKETGTQWLDNFESKLRNIRRESRVHHELLKDELPEGFVQLHENPLHDAHVISFEHLSEQQEFILVLNHNEDGEEINVNLTFTGVKDLTLKENIVAASWLYEELYIDGDYFEVHILFESPLTEFYIKAQNLKIEKIILG